MNDKKIAGQNIFLRSMTEEDINSNYISWFANEAVTNFLNARNIDIESAKQFFFHGVKTGQHVQLAICDNKTKIMIGSVKIGPIDTQNMLSDLVTIIGNTDYWGKGLAKEAIRLASDYAFTEMGIRKVTGGIISGNISSIKSYTGGGWLVEGILAGHYLQGSEVQDRVIVSSFNPKYFTVEQLSPIQEYSRKWLANLKSNK